MIIFKFTIFSAILLYFRKLKGILHESPRNIGKEINLWMLDL